MYYFTECGKWWVSFMVFACLMLLSAPCGTTDEAPSCLWTVNLPGTPLKPRDIIDGTLMLYVQKWERAQDVVVTFKSPRIGNLMGLELSGEHQVKKQDGVNVRLINVKVSKISTLMDGFIDTLTFSIPMVKASNLSSNRLDIYHQFQVVDPIDVSPNQTYWLTATVTISSFYLWTGKEALKFMDNNTNIPLLQFIVEGELHRLKIQGHLYFYYYKIWHHPTSKATAQNITVDLFNPPYVRYKTNEWLDKQHAPLTFLYIQAANKLRICVPLLPLTSILRGRLQVYLDPNKKVPLIWNGGEHKLLFQQTVSWYGKTGLMIENYHKDAGPLQARRKEEGLRFRVKNLQTRQCVSYDEATSSLILSNNCQRHVYHYTKSGALMSGFEPQGCVSCFSSGSKLLRCQERDYAQIMFLGRRQRFCKVLSHHGSTFMYVGGDKKVTCIESYAKGKKFYVLPELRKGAILSQPSKSFLQASLVQSFLFCSRHNNRKKRKCYLTENHGRSWVGLHPLISSLYGYEKSTKRLYFVDHFGRGYLIAKLGEQNKMVFYEDAVTSIRRANAIGDLIRAVEQDDNLPDFTDTLFQSNLRASPRGLHYQESILGSSRRQIVDYGF